MRKLAILTVALLALPSGVTPVGGGRGSSHREAPLTSLDPTADDTDVYAFTANDAPGALTVVANWIPFEDPAGGPNFYRFDDRATTTSTSTTPATASTTSGTSSSSRPRSATRTRSSTRCPASARSTTRSSTSCRPTTVTRETLQERARTSGKRIAQRPAGRAEQRRAQDDPELRRGRQPGDQVAAGRRQGVRRPASTTRSSSTSARRSTRSTSAPGTGNRQPGRRQGRPGGLQRPLDRPAGARVAGHA